MVGKARPTAAVTDLVYPATCSVGALSFRALLDGREHSFSQRTINEWNKLSTDCVTASSVNMFKNKVDTYLRRAGYK